MDEHTKKQLCSLPILENMVFISLAVKWAMVCGVKDRNVYKQLKKHYYVHEEEQQNYGAVSVRNGWYIPLIEFPKATSFFVGTDYSFTSVPDSCMISHCRRDSMTRHFRSNHIVTSQDFTLERISKESDEQYYFHYKPKGVKSIRVLL